MRQLRAQAGPFPGGSPGPPVPRKARRGGEDASVEGARALPPSAARPSEEPSSATTMNVEHEVSLLVEEIRRLGTRNADGQVSVKFGVLFADEKCANLFEALVGTLKAAKRRKIITYPGELLLQGVHDDVDIMLLQD